MQFRWVSLLPGNVSVIKNLANKSVLLVDDNARMLRELEKVLGGEGCKVTCASLLADAIDILLQKKTLMDLVITDLWRPTVTSLAGLHAIHNLFPDVPVIVLSTFGSSEVKAACLRLRVPFLEKPLETWQLLSAVEGVFASQKAAP